MLRTFTLSELQQYDGRDGKVYVAFKGKVFDVSESYHWRNGIHQVLHRGGCDVTEDLNHAPHSPDLLQKFPVVGKLIE